MLGWFSDASTWASRSKRARRSGPRRSAAGRTLIATSRFELGSRARDTPRPCRLRRWRSGFRTNRDGCLGGATSRRDDIASKLPACLRLPRRCRGPPASAPASTPPAAATSSTFPTIRCRTCCGCCARAIRTSRTTLATREEEAFGIAAGLYLGGARPTVMLQSSGLGNSFNALTSLLLPYQIPALIVISMRGDAGEWNYAQVPMGRAVAPICDAIGLPHATADSAETTAETVALVGQDRVRHAAAGRVPAAAPADRAGAEGRRMTRSTRRACWPRRSDDDRSSRASAIRPTICSRPAIAPPISTRGAAWGSPRPSASAWRWRGPTARLRPRRRRVAADESRLARDDRLGAAAESRRSSSGTTACTARPADRTRRPRTAPTSRRRRARWGSRRPRPCGRRPSSSAAMARARGGSRAVGDRRQGRRIGADGEAAARLRVHQAAIHGGDRRAGERRPRRTGVNPGVRRQP